MSSWKILFIIMALSFLCVSCSKGQPTPIVNYALEGPPLALVARVNEYTFEGTLDRKGMVGMGEMVLQSLDRPDLVCKGELQTMPGAKGRIRSAVPCSDGTVVMFSLRNLGPDQGLGIGTFALAGSEEFGVVDDDLRRKALRADNGAVRAPLGGVLVLFYHPSKEEALRLLDPIQKDMMAVINQARMQDKGVSAWNENAVMPEPKWSKEDLENVKWRDAGTPTP